MVTKEGAQKQVPFDALSAETEKRLTPQVSPTRPLAGEAYQGFLDFDLLIPVWIAGETAPRLVPVDTTIKALQTQIGRTIIGVKRLDGWFPASVATEKKPAFRAKPRGGRVTIGLGLKSPGTIHTPSRDWAADMLVAPGDILMVR